MIQVYKNAAAAVSGTTRILLNSPKLDPLVEGTRHEIINYRLTITEPWDSLIASEARKFNYRYMTAEAFWNIADRDDIAFLKRYHSGIEQFVANQDVGHSATATWAYGKQLNAQFAWAYQQLAANRSTRQAVIVNKGMGLAKGTPPCLVNIQWLIRDGKLEQITTMRSNDVWFGMPMDLYQFGIMHRLMAAALNVRVGTYHHNVGSMHLYDRDVQRATDYINARSYALTAPSVLASGALNAAIADIPGQMVQRYGHRAEDKEYPENYIPAPGLQSYVALLIGDYARIGDVFNALRVNKFGIGW